VCSALFPLWETGNCVADFVAQVSGNHPLETPVAKREEGQTVEGVGQPPAQGYLKAVSNRNEITPWNVLSASPVRNNTAPSWVTS